jgi:hypothetical protein
LNPLPAEGIATAGTHCSLAIANYYAMNVCMKFVDCYYEGGLRR